MSVRVKFTADFNYHLNSRTTIAHKAGAVVSVEPECAEQAVKAGKAVRVGIPAMPEGMKGNIRKRRRARDE